MRIAIHPLGILAILSLLSGCASIDYDYPRSESHHFSDTSDTYLAQEFLPIIAGKPVEQAGFIPLADGVDALAARLMFAQRAERSIDLQYYLIKDDIVGRAFIATLLQAADRGVRVRFLLDDILTSGFDSGLLALDSHPNFEIRIFNPLFRGTAGKLKSATTNLSTMNRRMHNKSFTVDNQITIVGGRNISNHYFGASEKEKFGDLDVAGIGPVVDDVSNMFDTYWNHETALPPAAFAKQLEDPVAALDDMRQQLGESTVEIRGSRYAAAVRSQIVDYLDSPESLFKWAPYQLTVDSPDKGNKKKAKDAASITTPLIASLQSAEKELIIISPYFVPRKAGIEALSAMQQRGINVIVVTNSLAANNQFTVHGGYAPARKPLLGAGVKIYEVRPDADVAGTEFVDSSGARATLHTKAFTVDDREIFIGSFNFDPRSANLNTELGVIIRDPELTSDFSTLVRNALQHQTYDVFLNEDGKVRWRGIENNEEVIYEKEPETTWGQRFWARFARIIPKSQL